MVIVKGVAPDVDIVLHEVWILASSGGQLVEVLRILSLKLRRLDGCSMGSSPGSGSVERLAWSPGFQIMIPCELRRMVQVLSAESADRS